MQQLQENLKIDPSKLSTEVLKTIMKKHNKEKSKEVNTTIVADRKVIEWKKRQDQRVQKIISELRARQIKNKWSI